MSDNLSITSLAYVNDIRLSLNCNVVRRKNTTKNGELQPKWRALRKHAVVPIETRAENTEERVRFSGPGAELLRGVHVEHLRAHMEVLYEHGSTADILALCAAFDLLERGWRERSECERTQATLIEAVLATLGFSSEKLLERDLQQRPLWPV